MGLVLLMAIVELNVAAEVEGARSMVLRVGEQKSLSARGIRSYSEGAPGLADIRVTRDQTRFVIVGKQEGTTSLLLIKNDGHQIQYTIRVIPADADKGFGSRENIRLDLYFVSIQDRYSHQIGLNWPGNIGSTITPSQAAIAITGGSGQATQSAFQILPQTFLPSFDLAQAKGCMACHQVAIKVVGPAYKDVAAKYKDQADAAKMLAAKVKAGGVGTWGQIPMPPQATLTDDEANALVAWVLAQ